jgi:hypothetical protein
MILFWLGVFAIVGGLMACGVPMKVLGGLFIVFCGVIFIILAID